MSTLLGSAEACELLGLTRQGLHKRRALPDFPAPFQTLRATPVWRREDLVQYAKARSERFHERAAVEELAREGESVVDVLSLDDAAEVLGVPSSDLEHLAASDPHLPARRLLKTRELTGIPSDSLVLWRLALLDRRGSEALVF